MSATTTDNTAPSLRRVASLALPALVVLAAEPLYVLVDTAVVGHLGRLPLASLAIGAGDRSAAVGEGVQASWLALGAGLFIAIGAQFGAGPVAHALAGQNATIVA